MCTQRVISDPVAPPLPRRCNLSSLRSHINALRFVLFGFLFLFIVALCRAPNNSLLDCYVLEPSGLDRSPHFSLSWSNFYRGIHSAVSDVMIGEDTRRYLNRDVPRILFQILLFYFFFRAPPTSDTYTHVMRLRRSLYVGPLHIFAPDEFLI